MLLCVVFSGSSTETCFWVISTFIMLVLLFNDSPQQRKSIPSLHVFFFHGTWKRMFVKTVWQLWAQYVKDSKGNYTKLQDSGYVHKNKALVTDCVKSGDDCNWRQLMLVALTWGSAWVSCLFWGTIGWTISVRGTHFGRYAPTRLLLPTHFADPKTQVVWKACTSILRLFGLDLFCMYMCGYRSR